MIQISGTKVREYGRIEELNDNEKKKKKTLFDYKFLRQLSTLMKIMIPSIFCRETGIIGE